MDTADILIQLANTNKIRSFRFCQIDYSKDTDCQNNDIHERLFHRANIGYLSKDADELSKEMLLNFTNDGFILNSQVVLQDGSISHLPLMDFDIEVSEASQRIVTEVLFALDIKTGYLLDSGSSYHFIGNETMKWEVYQASLYRALLLDPITDGRWIAHQLINGSSNLRIGEKNGVTPQLISIMR